MLTSPADPRSMTLIPQWWTTKIPEGPKSTTGRRQLSLGEPMPGGSIPSHLDHPPVLRHPKQHHLNASCPQQRIISFSSGRLSFQYLRRRAGYSFREPYTPVGFCLYLFGLCFENKKNPENSWQLSFNFYSTELFMHVTATGGHNTHLSEIAQPSGWGFVHLGNIEELACGTHPPVGLAHQYPDHSFAAVQRKG